MNAVPVLFADIQNGAAKPVHEPARAVRYALDFSRSAFYQLDFSELQNQKRLSVIECIYVDNADGTAPIVLSVDLTQQTVEVEIGQYGYYQLMFGYPARLNVSSPNSTSLVNLFALNVNLMGSWKKDPSASPSPSVESVAVTNFPATQGVSGSIEVSNFPATQAVSDAALEAIISAGAAKVAVQNYPASQVVHVDNLPATQAVSGSVSIANLPATQAVSDAALEAIISAGAAKVAVQNYPASQVVHVDNLPATQAVSGSVSIANLPATQAVSDAALEAGLANIGTIGTGFRVGRIGSNGAFYPDMAGNLAYVNQTLGNVSNFITGNPGYFITGIQCDLWPSSSPSGTFQILFSDSSSGNIWGCLISSAGTQVGAESVSTPGNFFWNNKASNSKLSMVINTNITGGGLLVRVQYGFCSFVG